MKRRDISLLLRQPDDLRAWLQETREYLYWKMQREQSSLDRRRTRGVHTSTDEDLEADQILEANLLDLLDEEADQILEANLLDLLDEMAAKLEESI